MLLTTSVRTCSALAFLVCARQWTSLLVAILWLRQYYWPRTKCHINKSQAIANMMLFYLKPTWNECKSRFVTSGLIETTPTHQQMCSLMTDMRMRWLHAQPFAVAPGCFLTFLSCFYSSIDFLKLCPLLTIDGSIEWSCVLCRSCTSLLRLANQMQPCFLWVENDSVSLQ